MFALVPLTQPDEKGFGWLQDTLAVWSTPNNDGQDGLPPRCLYLRPYRDLFKRAEFVQLLRVIAPAIEAGLSTADVHTAEDVGDKQDETDGTKADPCRATLVVSDLGDRLEWEDWWRARIGECFPTLATWKRLNVLSFNSCELAIMVAL